MKLAIGFVLLILICSTSYSKNGLTLKLQGESTYVRVILQNDLTKRYKKLNARLSVGSRFGKDTELTFIIKNEKGRVFHYMANYRIGKPGSDSIISLDFNSIVGRVYTFKQMKYYYNLKPGKYSVQAVYRNYYDTSSVYSKEHKSNVIIVHIK